MTVNQSVFFHEEIIDILIAGVESHDDSQSVSFFHKGIIDILIAGVESHDGSQSVSFFSHRNN